MANVLRFPNQPHGSRTIMQAAWLMLAACTAGCPTLFEPGPTRDLQEVRQHTSSPSPVFESFDSTVWPPFTVAAADDPMVVNRYGRPDLLGQQEPTRRFMPGPSHILLCAGSPASRGTADQDPSCNLFASQAIEQPRPVRYDLGLRPPLRQLWFHHPRLVPLGSDVELRLPDSEILAHRDRVTSRPFRNPYAGFRDQPLLHRDSSSASMSKSTLSEIGPPPPHHTVKTFGTLTALSVVGIGVYAWAPSSFTGTNKDGSNVEDAWGHFKQAWTKPPVIDKDPMNVNYLGHPYFGMNFYLSQRNYGESPLYSFLFSTFTSTCFEYFIESWSERPSIQDLIITPVVGSMLGELVYRATQEMRKDGFTKAEKIILTIINPLYVLQNGYR